MWTSVAYHLYNVMGPRQGEVLLKYDLTGIVAVMLACFLGIAYTIFYEWSFERNVIIGVLTPMLISNFFVLFHPACIKDSMHCYKVFVIASTQVLLYLTAIVGRVYLSTDYQIEHIYPRLFSAFIYVIIGFLFWLSKFPERVSFLGQFETIQLVFNSHVFWHLLVFACEYNLYWVCFDLNLKHE